MNMNRIAISIFIASALIGLYLGIVFLEFVLFQPSFETGRVMALPFKLPYYLFDPTFNDGPGGSRLLDTAKALLVLAANIPIWSVPVYAILAFNECRRNKLP